MFSFWSYVFILLASLRLSSSKLTQVTVDDQFPDSLTGTQVIYTPNSQWLYNAVGHECPGCSALDPSRTRNGTWRSNFYKADVSRPNTGLPPNAAISFTGSSVSVYCIIPPRIQSHITIFLDGLQVYESVTNGGDGIAYNNSVYTNNTMAMGDHTLIIQNGLPDGNEYFMILDYVTFLTDIHEQSGSAPSNSSKVKVLTGILVAVCILFTIILVYLLYRLYATRKRRVDLPSTVDMENLHTSSPKAGWPSVWKWLTRYLSFNTNRRSFSFNRSLFVVGRSRQRGESVKDFAQLDMTAGGQPQPQPVLTAEVLPETQSRSRWAFVMSWRDRAMREAQIPTLPPTSHAPTTIFSGPNTTSQIVHHKPLKGQQEEDTPEAARPQTRRTFTIVNA